MQQLRPTESRHTRNTSFVLVALQTLLGIELLYSAVEGGGLQAARGMNAYSDANNRRRCVHFIGYRFLFW
jgi:hypothetical protein